HDQAWTNLFEFNFGRRNQPRAGESSERVIGSYAGTAGHNWRTNLTALRSIPGARDSKPNRTGRPLPTARGATRSFHVQVEYRLPTKTRGTKHPRFDGDFSAGFASRLCSRAEANHR